MNGITRNDPEPYSGILSAVIFSIPSSALYSAILRFAIYEELRRAFSNEIHPNLPLYFMQGALVGAISSGIMTPLDVVKTRIATNTISNHLSII